MARTIRNKTVTTKTKRLAAKERKEKFSKRRINPHAFRPRTKIDKEARHYQKTEKFFVSNAAFKRCIVDIIKKLGRKRDKAASKVRPEALKALQTAAEASTSDVLSDANEVTLHAKRKTLILPDLYLAICMREYDLSVLQQFKPSH